MSLAKKIIFLLLALILLMIVCVITHINDFENIKEKSTMPTISAISLEEPEAEVVTPTTEIRAQEEAPSLEVINKNIEITKELTPVETLEKEVIPSFEKKIEKKTEKKSNAAIQEEINSALKVQRIIFKRLSTQVTEKSYITIKKIAEILSHNPDIKIEVGGHTDARGADDVNEYISLKRAKSVRNDLIKLGINKERISAKGYGKTKPIVKNDPQGYSTINRRVEFKIIEE